MSTLGPHIYFEDSSEIIESATELFEIDDFTSPSPWEKFVSEFEQVLRDWNLHKISFKNKKKKEMNVNDSQWPWKLRYHSFIFHNFEFKVTEYSRRNPDGFNEEDDDEEDTENNERSWRGTTPDFVHALMAPGNKEFPWFQCPHPIHYYYGLNHFIVLSPSPQENEEIDNETRSKMALSTLAVGLSNTHCPIPCFVQVMDRYKDNFNGFSIGGNGIRTNYEMILLKKRPPNCDHLTGLLHLFKSKIGENCDMELSEMPSVKVTARFSYILDDWTTYGWSQAAPDMDFFSPEDLSSLPFGATKDPIKELKLHASWYDLPEDIITDNDIHSDLDLLEAPSWSIGVRYEENPQCLLTEYLKLFHSICDQSATIRQLLGEDMFKDEEKFPDVFNRLTGASTSTAGFSSMINRIGRSTSATLNAGPIKADHLIRILDYLFPDASEDNRYPYPATLETTAKQQFSGMIKSCPIDGLVWRLCIVFAHCLHVFGGLKPLAHLMHEFLLEVRFRYENGVLLPGLPSGNPDQGFCLIHQKLQMINCCIEKKIAREQGTEAVVKADDESKNSALATEESEDDEDQFYDCDDDQELPAWSKDPVGRMKRLGKQKLLHHDDYIYVPICQDPTPLTEDMLAEQAEMMLQLGMDAQGAELRAKMQSAALLSDMESFKAANPGCILADFVRWHSPRDWENGALSSRMTSEKNIWTEAWENAKPVAAKRQKRLFDDTREAEKVLQYLTNLKPSEAAHLLMPVLQHVAVTTLSQAVSENSADLGNLSQIEQILRNASEKLSIASRLRCLAEVKHFIKIEEDEGLAAEVVRRSALIEDVLRNVQLAEMRLSQAISLKTKFLLKNFEAVQNKAADSKDKVAFGQQMTNFTLQLLDKAEVGAIGAARGPVGQLVIQMFKDAHKASQMIVDHESSDDEGFDIKKVFPKPAVREFVLKVNCSRPYTYSQPTPQRLYCSLKPHEFRVAGAFSIDQQFM